MHSLAGDERDGGTRGPGLWEGQLGHCAGQMCMNHPGNSPRGAFLQFPFPSGLYATSLELQRRGIPAGSGAEPSEVGMLSMGNAQAGVFSLGRGTEGEQRQQTELPVLPQPARGCVCWREPQGKEAAHSWLSTAGSAARGFLAVLKVSKCPSRILEIICQWIYVPW